MPHTLEESRFLSASRDERDVKVRVYGGTAIVNGLARLKLTVNGTPISGDHRATFVWVKQKGNWKEISLERMRVASASQ